MKKLIGILMVMALCVFSFVGCESSKAQADKYDKENYIGAADISEELTDEYALTRKDMSNFSIKGDVAVMNGLISSDTIRQVEKLIKDYPDVKTIEMVNVEGSIDDESNLIASRLVRKAGLNTDIKKSGLIASGGTDFFCAGVKRTAEKGAKIGVHSWSDGEIMDASKLSKDNKEHKKYIDYYREMKMPDPEGFYFFTIKAADASNIHYMSMDELEKYGLVTEK